jgi:hypothetical protein
MTAHRNSTTANQRHRSIEVSVVRFIDDADDDAYDLRDTLEETVVREGSFSEFRAALMQYRQRLH